MQIGTIRAGKGIGPLAAGLLLHAFFQTWLARAGYHFEEFRDLQVAQGLANGATLYGDMDWIYGPLHPYALHEFFSLTGLPLEILTVRYLGVALGAAGFLGAYAFARRLMSPGWSSFAAFLACWVFLPPRPTYNHHWAAAAALVWLPIAASYVERAGKGAAALMAITTSIACLSKPIPIGGALFILSLFVVAIQGFQSPDRGHRVISTAIYLIVILVGTVLPYAWIAEGSGWESVLEGLRPKTFQDEQIGFSLIPASLKPSTFVSQWGPIFGNDPSGGWSGALAHLILLSDILALGWGGYRVLRSLPFSTPHPHLPPQGGKGQEGMSLPTYSPPPRWGRVRVGVNACLRRWVGTRRDEDIYYWILVPAALLLGCETLLFGRLMMIYGARAPIVLLLVILVTDFAHRSRGDQSNASVRWRMAAKFCGMAVFSLPLVYLVGVRIIPLASGTLERPGTTKEGERFSDGADLSGMRGVRMSADAVHFYESVLEEITSRSDQPGSVALWSYFPVVAFPLGARNIFSDRMHLFAHDLRTRTRRKDGPAITLLEEATRRVEEKKPALLVFLQHLSGGRGEEPDLGAETAVGGVRYHLVYTLTANVSAHWIERALIFERVQR